MDHPDPADTAQRLTGEDRFSRFERSLVTGFLCAVRRSVIPLFLALALCIGCGPSRQRAHYGWLRKEGARSATTTPGVREKRNVPAEDQADKNTSADINEQVSVALTISDSKSEDQVPHISLLPDSASLDTPRQKNSLPQDTSYYSQQHHPWNGKAIASLPLAVATVVIGLATQGIYLLLIGGAISFTLGLIASRQCRDRGDHGKGLAIAAMVLGAAALFFSLMVLITAA